MTSSDREQLELIRESLYKPEAEEKAKELLLREIYAFVRKAYRELAPNGGRLVGLPECVEKDEICPEDKGFTYNAIRVLLARYMVRNEYGVPMETPSMVMARVAWGFSTRVDPVKLYRLLIARKFMFNSPTLFNMYVDGAYGTLSACYVTPVYDDMKAIMDAATVQAMTFKWGGGQGFSFSELRPRWDIVRSTGGQASGPLSFMQIYDMVTETVKQGGKRRGANMGIMHAWHPDIYNPHFNPWHALRNMLPPQLKALIDTTKRLIEHLEREGYEIDPVYKEIVMRLSEEGWETVEDAGFIQAKEPPLQDANLTNFNISVAANDAFMQAILRGEDWWMVNPRYSDSGDGVYRLHYSVSRATGLGRLGELLERYPWLLENPYLNIFEDVLEEAKTKALEALKEQARYTGWETSPEQKNPYAWKYPARKLWEKIVENAWASGDPGLFFPDNHNKWNPTPWLGAVYATNPCGEQPLYPFESCNLGSMSIDKYISDGKFDLAQFMSDIQLAVDSMDAVIDFNKHPDPRQTVANKFTRKIGLGIMGLADALAKLGYPYDSEEAVAFTLIVMAALEVYSWKRSWELGAKLGHAPAFECRRYDWKSMRCVEKAEPEELVELHTPALLKASRISRVEDGWLKVCYHAVEIPEDMLERLVGEAKSRIEPNGTVKLVRWEAVEKVLREVFGVTREDYERALRSSPVIVVNSPKLLLALAVYNPEAAWKVLKAYGRSLGARAPRNTVMTTVAPTGTISIIAGTSSGIEPYFALVYRRVVAIGEFLEVVKPFREKLLEAARRYNVPLDAVKVVYETIGRHKGSLRWALGEVREKLIQMGIMNGFLAEVEKLARLFTMSMDFDLWYHLAHQIAAQLYVDQAISKTINLRKDATKDEVYTAYLVAWLGGLKGVTVYRDESKGVQVIYFGGEHKEIPQSPIRGKAWQPSQQKDRKAMRMIHLKKRMKLSELEKDKRATELFETKQTETNGDEVVVELTENSTCKHCEL
ncbi:adenosylcobalamin-dependent ribonucleoside-diphosphate reductase [Hyperthermus butylicus]|uniref:Vitamin B12-dependent ribonucleotide reductase n=1 Tax=Hyperthermus butylicus (strain DSM 5456 / JCM 9403 / PLM1-5) TaxID=415426 RepID=A2BL44_HYPBU|nr:adenosylcobalamin-dependent ribonucleoside-diphosphate reductase [Hyperthermus butylicus]ABM80705.1 putative ribonucleotide reductase, alpha subunit [Hyperthermus butylicus DSM 5456]